MTSTGVPSGRRSMSLVWPKKRGGRVVPRDVYSADLE